MVILLPIPILAMGMIAGAVMFMIGLRTDDNRLKGWGETAFGLSMSILVLVALVDIVSISSEHPEPLTVELALLLALSFVGVILTALGLRQILAARSHGG